MASILSRHFDPMEGFDILGDERNAWMIGMPKENT